MPMYEPKIIFDSTPYVQVAHSRKIALRCYACGRTVVMNANFCDGRSCPLCGGAVTPIGYVAPMRNPSPLYDQIAPDDEFIRYYIPCPASADKEEPAAKYPARRLLPRRNPHD